MSGVAFRRWWIDPGGGRFCRRNRRLVDEALRVVAERLIERELASGVDGIGLAVVYLVRSHQTDAAMVVILVVPIEEVAAEASGVLAIAPDSRMTAAACAALGWRQCTEGPGVPLLAPFVRDDE
jgi:hypothetical protein